VPKSKDGSGGVPGDFPLRTALEAAEPKPPVSALREPKHAYAFQLSRALARTMASALRPRFPQVLPTEKDVGHESPTKADFGRKRVDVKVWDEDLGLSLLVSIKTYSFRDWNTKKQTANRYTKNVRRNRLELQEEAARIHRRQPYAVLIAVMFEPITACDDGKPGVGESGISSFAHAVRELRHQAGRTSHAGAPELFERVFIGLYEYDDPARRGQVRFFDVTQPPPRTGRPKHTLALSELMDEIHSLTEQRNKDLIEWGEAEPSKIDEPDDE
jgi:hypothetical protein